MTCIVGLIDQEKVYIGADSVAANTSQWTLDRRDDPKVFQTGEFLIGYTTSFRMGQLLRFSLKVPDQSNHISDHAYMCTVFIDAVRECLKTGGYAHKKEERESGGTFLVAYKKKLYEVCDDYQVSIPGDGIAACGCGTYFALGSLFSTKGQEATARIFTALQAAEEFSAYVRGPFVIEKM